MNILTFDIEDWYNCDFITPDFDWNKYEVRIYEGTNRILNELEQRNQKATFFCLGWVAEKHPDVIRSIHNHGHHIGCHSYQHELAWRFDREAFKQDTEKAKKKLEDVAGVAVTAYRAPAFSITANNTWAFEVLSELGFEYDCSILPAYHDYGGLLDYGNTGPAIVLSKNGSTIKEFPINTKTFLGKPIVFSGGGYFRLFPYFMIKSLADNSDYMMTYFHTRDFDPDQPMINSLPMMRKFKSYVGLKNAFRKFQNLLDDFHFVDILEADKEIDWNKARMIEL